MTEFEVRYRLRHVYQDTHRSIPNDVCLILDHRSSVSVEQKELMSIPGGYYWEEFLEEA